MKILLLLYITITFLGCSSYVQRTFQSQEEYLAKINKELINKDVLVHLMNNKNEEGKYINIDINSLIIVRNDTLTMNLNNVHSISYKKIGPSWFIGALAGFSIGVVALVTSGATFDVGGNSKYPYMFYVVPASTFIGSILAGVTSDNYKTLVIQK